MESRLELEDGMGEGLIREHCDAMQLGIATERS